MKLDQALSQGKQDRLRIDVGTSVMFKLDRMEEPVKAVLVGMSEGNYILLHPPPSFVEQKKISEGEGILIRYMHGGTVYEFKSAVRRLQEEYDAAILTVAYPGVKNLATSEERNGWIAFFLPLSRFRTGITAVSSWTSVRPGARCV